MSILMKELCFPKYMRFSVATGFMYVFSFVKLISSPDVAVAHVCLKIACVQNQTIGGLIPPFDMNLFSLNDQKLTPKETRGVKTVVSLTHIHRPLF